MKKLFLYAVIGAAITIVGCSKKDSTTNEQGNMDVSFITNELESKEPYNPWAAQFLWYSPLTDTCQELRGSDSICGINICKTPTTPVAIDVFFDEDGVINLIGVKNYESLPNGSAQGFKHLLEVGYVTILHDTPINDQNLLAFSNNDYIPAGTFPIYKNEDDAMIEISY